MASRHRSRSRSPPRRRSRSRSRSRSPRRRRSRSRSRSRRRSHRSRSPWQRSNDQWRREKEKRMRNREAPEPSQVLGVFGLSDQTTEEELREIFGKHGKIEKIVMISDRATGQSKGFGFIYFDTVGDATSARDACNGMTIDNRKIRTDYSVTKKPHEPTPGIYMGRASQRWSYSRDERDPRDREGGRSHERGGRRRHRSPSRDRSRSRSRGRDRRDERDYGRGRDRYGRRERD